MRMWMVDPKLLCRRHLLGEHVELHMFVGTIDMGNSLKGYVDNGLVEVHNIRSRHAQLVEEMIRRGYNHNSPLQDFDPWEEGRVDVEANHKDLLSRCEECRRLSQ